MTQSIIVIGNPVDFRAQKFSDFAATLLADNTSFLPLDLDKVGTDKWKKKPDWQVLPKDENGDAVWKPLESRLPTSDEVERWYGNGVARGIGIIQGRGRELLDLDVKRDPKRAELAAKYLQDPRTRDIIRRCPVVATPNDGYHVYFRCDETEGNQVLAKRLDGLDTFIETRGPGGYAAAPPTPGYRLVSQVPIEQTPTITPEERALLFAVAREFSEVMIPTRAHRQTVAEYDDPDPSRPGSIFNRAAVWQDILEPKGWTYLFGDEDVGYWERPGKSERATSAQTIGSVLLVYSSNASPFEAWSSSNRVGYTKFHAFALLYHDGDFSEAAGDVAERGFNDTEFFCHGEAEQKIEGLFADVGVEDSGNDLVRGEVVEDHEPSMTPLPKVCTDAKLLPDIKDDPLYAYLWRGYHGRYLTDDQRERRIATTKEVLQFIPPDSIFTDYLAGAMPVTDAPVWFHVASALSLSAYLINRRAYVMDGNRMCFPLFWIGVLAGSGTLHKSASINPVRQLLRDDPDLGGTQVRATTWAQLIDKIGIELRRNDDDDGRPTAAEARLMCESMDQEARCLNGLAYYHLGEIATLLASLNKTYNEEAKPTLTDWWDCPPDDLYETKTAGKYYIYRPFVSILGASTVDWFVAGCKHSDLMGGFLPRWLFFANGVQDFQLSQPDGTDEGIASRLMERCRDLKRYRGRVVFSTEAEDFYNGWYLENCKDADKAIAAWLARLTVYAKKIALVFEAASTGSTTISEGSTVLACKLVSCIKDGLVRLLDEQLAFSDTDRNVKRFVEMVRAHGGRIEHWRALRDMHVPVKRFKEEVVETAIQQGRIERLVVKNPKNGKESLFYTAL